MWSSQEGSLLLWLFLLGTWSSVILFLTRHRLRVLAPYATAVLLGFGAFFAGLLVFAESPFSKAPRVVSEGAGLNPLLRDPGMMIHPPMLYSGYTLFAIPFAFAVAALITRRLDAEWIRSTRPFTLAAWCALGFGIVLGARWSYHELDWGGYWMWDPVENASLMPWLTATAFLHSVMIQERRGMLRTWNVSLVLATGVLAILGHVPGAMRRAELDPRVRRVDARRPVPGADRGDDRGLDLPRGQPLGVAEVRAPAGLAAVARGDLPAQQLRARRALLRRLLGHLLPADRGGLHRAASATSARPSTSASSSRWR